MSKKYVFKPYSSLFPELFDKEKSRLLNVLGDEVEIEHVGSTAIPGLGGKGIIDIAITVDQSKRDSIREKLVSLGYEFRPSYSTEDRWYFIAFLPDPEEGARRYHVHLTSHGSSSWEELIGFRDYLRSHPEEVKAYAELKEKAVEQAGGDGESYRKVKEPMFQKIRKKNHLS